MRLKRNNFAAVGKSLSLIGSFGLTMGAAILLGYYIGSSIDSRLNTAPWCMLICTLLFIIGAFIKFIHEVGGLGKPEQPKGDINHSQKTR
ncbi:MAG: AtpZ/AtpI family protein [Desulfobacterota bacterium]|nr:AtpZ/AtpI family protein [Thermodesulfobacteriota bacterium]